MGRAFSESQRLCKHVCKGQLLTKRTGHTLRDILMVENVHTSTYRVIPFALLHYSGDNSIYPWLGTICFQSRQHIFCGGQSNTQTLGDSGEGIRPFWYPS